MHNGRVETRYIERCLCGELSTTHRYLVRDFSYGTCSNDFRIAHCKCGMHYLLDRPIDSELSAIYPSNYGAFNVPRIGLVRLIRKLNLRLKIHYLDSGKPAAASWLDFGCGSGELLEVLNQLGAGKLIAVDTESNLSDDLRAKVAFVDADALEKLPSHCVDRITSIQSIEHVPDPLKVLCVFFRILTPGGRLLIETPTPSGLDFRLGGGVKWGGWHAPRHFYVFTKQNLINFAQKAGFEIVSTKSIPSPYIWAQTIRARYPRTVNWRGPFSISISNPFFFGVSTVIDVLTSVLHGSTSNFRVVLKKPNLPESEVFN